MPIRQGANFSKKLRKLRRFSCRRTTPPAASTPWTWKTDFAMSRPIVVIVCMFGSSESWEPQQSPYPWHSRAGGGAVHSINNRHSQLHKQKGRLRGNPTANMDQLDPGRPLVNMDRGT